MKVNKNTAYRKLIRTISNHVKHYSYDLMLDFVALQKVEEESEKENNVATPFVVKIYYRECGTYLLTTDDPKLANDYATHSDRVFTLEKISDNVYNISDAAC